MGSGNLYGDVTSFLFHICDSLYWHHNIDVPSHWQYGPGCGRPEDDPETNAFFDNCDPEALIRFGNILEWLYNYCKRKGLDY
jgi:hypothetical protein